MSGADTQDASSIVNSSPNRPSSLSPSRVRAAWAFVTPTLLVLALIAGWPLARTIWFSLTDANLSDLNGYEFIGTENYLAT